MLKPSTFFFVLFTTCSLFAQEPKSNPNQNKDDEVLLAQFIHAKGNNTIVFDSANIKQFWIDKSVSNQGNSFRIILKANEKQEFESVPLRIQLANVNEAQDCKIDVIANSKDFGFSILDKQKKVLSSSNMNDKFIGYNIASSIFHLEDTSNTTFDCVFYSKSESVLSVKKIILSFTENRNSHFLVSPGILKITPNNIVTSDHVKKEKDSVFSITGKRSAIFSDKKILTSNTPISSSVTIKNTGAEDTRIYVGYAVYSKDHTLLDGRNYPHGNNNKVLIVLSTSEEGKKILVDSYSDWSQYCYLALNAKEDMSDIPNTILGGRIIEIKKLDNGQAEILLEKVLGTPLKKGDKVRVHGMSGSYFYTSYLLLHPEEEKEISVSIQKDDSCLEYNASKPLSRGVYYIVPLVLSYSIDPTKDNTILISNFTISY